jgi:LysW-gamma-L-lysine carboxypeptidase
MTGLLTDPLELLLGALKVYSPSTRESKLANYLSGKMEKLGYSRVHTDSAGNVLGEAGRGKVRLLLCGHMDTIPGELQVRKTKGIVYGRGAADAKSPLCALLMAGASSPDSGVRITFAGVTEEEGEGAGINSIMKEGSKYDYAVFGEPGGASKVAVGYRGRVSIYVSVKTPGGHAGSPWAHRSAFDEFSSMLSRLKEYENSKAVPGDHFRSLSISPTLVRAGTFHNVVPSLCEGTLDLRIPPQMRAADAVREIRAAAETRADGVSIELTAGEATEAYEADTSSNLVRAFQRAIILQLNNKPGLIRKTGTGDMNTFAHRNHIECVTYGPGQSRTSHTDSEAVEIKDYLDSIEVLKEAIRQLGNLGRGRHS